MKIFKTMFLFFVILSANRLLAQEIFKNAEQRQLLFRLILGEELKKVYDEIFVPAEKENWEERYWKILDPTPNTEINEYYEEFIRRVVYANKYYSNIVAPLFIDDRGKYYVRYGEPDDKVSSVGVGMAYDDNETWAYYDLNLFIDFVDNLGFGFREVNSLFEAVSGGPANQKVSTTASLYLERESLHEKYSRFREVLNRSYGLSSESYFYRFTEDMSVEKKIMLETIPPARYSFSYNKESLNANISSSVFRENHGFSRVEFYFSFPLNQLQFSSGTQIPFESLVEKQLTIFNQKFEKIFQNTETLKLAANTQEQIDRTIYLNQHNEELPPGIYNIALKLDNVNGNRLAILRAQLFVKDYSGDSLMISDIQISSQIKENVTNARNLKPNAIQVIPYIGNQINRSRPIYIYFEIYNLAVDQNDRSRFEIRYDLQAISMEQTSAISSAIQFISHLIGKKSKENVGSTFQTEGDGSFQQIYLSIDFSQFSTGPCKLTVNITDQQVGNTVRHQRRFVLR